MIYKQIQEWNKQEGATQIFQPSRNNTEVFALNKFFINSSCGYLYSRDDEFLVKHLNLLKFVLNPLIMRV